MRLPVCMCRRVPAVEGGRDVLVNELICTGTLCVA